MPNPPAKVVKFAIGDGAMSEWDAFENAPAVRPFICRLHVLHAHGSVIGIRHRDVPAADRLRPRRLQLLCGAEAPLWL
jgi:hypothetical protein